MSKTTKRTPLSTSSEWTFDLLEAYSKEIERIGKDYLGLDTYPNQIEIISAEQMLDLYSSVGLPISYGHWSYGKAFVRDQRAYKAGQMGLAYEIVSNVSPCLVYCMEENTLCMMILVISHAGIGHNAFFRNNYMFKQWTDAESIVDYLVFAKNYISECEEKYGIDEVEEVLDACHALQSYGVDKYKRPSKISMVEEEQRQKQRNDYLQSQLDDVWRTIPERQDYVARPKENFPKSPEENILYFIEKNAPNLPTWKREIIRIVRKISQYFYPQKQTKVANEGFACVVGETLIDTPIGFIRADNLVNSKYSGEVYDGNNNERVVNWFAHPNKKRIKIITDYGYELHGGTNHKILVNGSWVELQHLSLGQEVSIVRGNNVWPSEFVQLPQYNIPTKLSLVELCKQHSVHMKTYYKWVNKTGVVFEKKGAACQNVQNAFEKAKTLTSQTNKQLAQRTQVSLPSVMDERFAYWLGLLVGDGNVHVGKHKFVNFTNQSEELLTFFTEFSEITFGVKCTRKPDRNHFKVTFNSNTVVEFLLNTVDIKSGYAAAHKVVPNQILKSPQPVIAAFLRGHFDTDGHVTKKYGNIVLVSKSKELIMVEQQILLKMGIVSTVHQQKSDLCYRLYIGGIDSVLFNDLIGFGVAYKDQALKDAIKQSKWRKIKPDTTHIIGIEYDEGPTYDFSVENSHQYKASCFVNHNCFVHYQIMQKLREENLISDGFMLEFLASHTAVIRQLDFDHEYYSGINPYALGFAMFMDIKRICEDPTDEDKRWFPEWAGGDWKETTQFAMKNFKDESFILQYLSPKVMRDLKLFSVEDYELLADYGISAIHDDAGYRKVRTILAKQYDLTTTEPNIQVYNVNRWGDRMLTLRHHMINDRYLEGPAAKETLRHLAKLWGFAVRLETLDESGTLKAFFEIQQN